VGVVGITDSDYLLTRHFVLDILWNTEIRHVGIDPLEFALVDSALQVRKWDV